MELRLSLAKVQQVITKSYNVIQDDNSIQNLAKIDDGRDESPTVIVGDNNDKKTGRK